MSRVSEESTPVRYFKTFSVSVSLFLLSWFSLAKKINTAYSIVISHLKLIIIICLLDIFNKTYVIFFFFLLWEIYSCLHLNVFIICLYTCFLQVQASEESLLLFVVEQDGVESIWPWLSGFLFQFWILLKRNNFSAALTCGLLSNFQAFKRFAVGNCQNWESFALRLCEFTCHYIKHPHYVQLNDGTWCVPVINSKAPRVLRKHILCISAL